MSEVDNELVGTLSGASTLAGTLTMPERLTIQANKNITPTDSQQVVGPDDGYDAMAQVTVEAASGGEDTLNTLFNTPAGQTPTPFAMSDDNENHTCYGFLNGLAVTLDSGIKSVETNAFERLVALKSIYGAGVETIKQSAFSNAINLNSASFPNCKIIQKEAFGNCYGLETISFPAVETIGESAFYGGQFHNVDFPNCVTIGKEAFGDANILTCNLPVCVTLGIGVLHNFKGQTLRLPAVQSMGRQQFRDCENLTDLYLGYDGVVTVTREEEWDDWEMFPWDGPMTINVHVPSGQLANYQADTTWQAIVTASASDNVTVTFVGDYV